MKTTRYLFPDQEEAAQYWAGKEFKAYVVSITAGPVNRPTHRSVMYVRARNPESAVKCARKNMLHKISGARFSPRLATAADLGCVRVEPK